MAINDPDKTPGATTASDIVDVEHVHVRLAAVAASVGHARGLVVALADRARPDAETRDAIALAISEAASNVVLHAYDDGDGVFELFAIRVGRELIASISDDGHGRSAAASDPGLGYGMRLIRESADAVSVRDGRVRGTVVQLRFALGPGQPAIVSA